MKKILAVAAMLAMVGALPAATVHAEPEMDQVVIETVAEEYLYTQRVTSSLTLSGSTATCTSKVTGKDGCTKIVATQRLQKKVLWWWSDVETWPKTVNGTSLSMTNYGTASDSGTYRVRIDATVYSGGSSENVYADSAEKTK